MSLQVQTGPTALTLRLALLLLALLLPQAKARADARFPLPSTLAANGHFWLRVYSEWTTQDYALHDDRQLDVVYKSIKAGNRSDPAVHKALGELRSALLRLNKKRPKSAKGLKGNELLVYRAWEKYHKDPGRFARGLGHVRAQKGQRDRFALALNEASRLRGHIEPILDAHDVPRELLALVFVESMFHPHARSYSGAVGLWQFMPATGREYLNINRLVDERRDPIIASNAAASYLRSAYRRLGDWPVAITSYNYGMNGMARAKRAVGRADLGLIVRSYRNGRLGFAAKNYYTEFWAALQIWKNPKKYFPQTRPQRSWRYDLLRVPGGLRLNRLIASGVVSRARLHQYNPALSRDALNGRIALPHGFALRLPRGVAAKAGPVIAKMAGLNAAATNSKTRAYKVRRGDSLIAISRRHGISTGQLLAANHMDLHATIYPGQKLRIPGKRSNFTLLPDARQLAVLQPAKGRKATTALASLGAESDRSTTKNQGKKNAQRATPPGQKNAARTRVKKRRRRRHGKLLADLPPPPRVLRFRVKRRRYRLIAGPLIEQPTDAQNMRPTDAPLAAVDVLLGVKPLPAVDVIIGRTQQNLHADDDNFDTQEEKIPNS